MEIDWDLCKTGGALIGLAVGGTLSGVKTGAVVGVCIAGPAGAVVGALFGASGGLWLAAKGIDGIDPERYAANPGAIYRKSCLKLVRGIWGIHSIGDVFAGKAAICQVVEAAKGAVKDAKSS